MTKLAEEIAYLRSPEAIRERSERIFEAGLYGDLDSFSVHLEELPAVARRVAELTRRFHPELDVPHHGRFQHFGAGGVDRVAELERRIDDCPPEEKARARIDLVVTSVLLDAGAGPHWSYREASTGLALQRSEGLAVASFHAFTSGMFSGGGERPLAATARGLETVDESGLGAAFQVGENNPLVGLEGRVALLRRLAAALEANETLFGRPPRVGNLYDHFAGAAKGGRIRARDVLASVLEGLSSIWPGRIHLDGANLGDAWRHPRAGGDGPTAGIVPFHKLSQWLTYSLVEPLERSELHVSDLNDLTGLAEYRNGGLFIDGSVLRPRRDDLLSELHEPGSELVVEWRALTIALLDRVAEAVRDELGVDRTGFPLTKVLEGGTWRAGRLLAQERRPGGTPPVRVRSDGTVF